MPVRNTTDLEHNMKNAWLEQWEGEYGLTDFYSEDEPHIVYLRDLVFEFPHKDDLTVDMVFDYEEATIMFEVQGTGDLQRMSLRHARDTVRPLYDLYWEHRSEVGEVA